MTTFNYDKPLPVVGYRVRLSFDDGTATFEDGTYKTRESAEAIAAEKARIANAVTRSLGIETPLRRIDIIEIRSNA